MGDEGRGGGVRREEGGEGRRERGGMILITIRGENKITLIKMEKKVDWE